MTVQESMSSANLRNGLPTRYFQPAAWFRKFRMRCAAPDCAQRDKLWPSFLNAATGLTFDNRWYCTMGCMHGALMTRIRSLLAGSVQERPRRHRLPLGLLLVDRGVISQQQLREALQWQTQSGGEKLGHVLHLMGAIASDDLTAALAQQWGCPTFPLDRQTALLGCHDLLPLSILESAFAVPAFASLDGCTLHLAFGERLDHTTLYAVEQMLGCRTVPCVAAEASVSRVLEELRRSASKEETSFDTMRDPQEITWTIRSYAGEYHPSRIDIARASDYLWVRFASGPATRDLLFRIRPESESRRALYSSAAKGLAASADSRTDGVSDAAGQP